MFDEGRHGSSAAITGKRRTCEGGFGVLKEGSVLLKESSERAFVSVVLREDKETEGGEAPKEDMDVLERPF